MTQFSFHRLILRAKYRRLDEISDAFERIQARIEAFPDGFSKGEAGFRELNEFMNLNAYFREVYQETNQTIPEWSFDLRNLGQLAVSGLIPLASFVSMVMALFNS